MLTLEQKHQLCLYPEVRVTAAKGRGSGTVVYSGLIPGDEDRYETYILTNYHVVASLVDFQKKWDPILKRDRKMEVLGTPTIETFAYDFGSRVIGGTSYQSDIMCYDKDEDLALLRVRAPQRFESVAKLYPRDEVDQLQCFMPLWTIGCGLGEKPIITSGYLSTFGIEIENKEFMLATSPIIFGNCLPANTLISMGDGSVKYIVDVEIGDSVWSYGRVRGIYRYRVEEKIATGNKAIFCIKTRTRTIQASANHPFLVIRSAKMWNNRRVNWLEWDKLENLEEGDVIAVLPSVPDRERPRGMNFEKVIGQYKDRHAFMRFLGFYLGDGWKRHEPGYRYEVSLAIYDKDAWETYAEIVRDLWGLEPTNYERGEVLTVNSRLLVELIDELGFSGKATEKTIPNWVMTLSRDLQMSFIEGYLEADGHINKLGDWVFEANNRDLIARLRMMFIHLGFNVSNLYERMREPCEINGRIATPNAPSVSFSVYPRYSKSRDTMIYGDVSRLPNDLVYERIAHIDEIGTEPTYDLKIEGAHNFFADGVLVHNSGGATFLEKTGQMVGVPARMAVVLLGWSPDAITHMSYIIPIWRVVQFFEDQVFQFIYDAEYTSDDCAELRQQYREQDEHRILRDDRREIDAEEKKHKQYEDNINPRGK